MFSRFSQQVGLGRVDDQRCFIALRPSSMRNAHRRGLDQVDFIGHCDVRGSDQRVRMALAFIAARRRNHSPYAVKNWRLALDSELQALVLDESQRDPQTTLDVMCRKTECM